MELHVNNVSATTASVEWSPAWRCPPGWAPRAVYRPNWDWLLSGTSPQQLQREERVAPGQYRVPLHGLAPLTGYIACVSCAPVPLTALLASSQQQQQQQHLTQAPALHGGQQGACVAFHTVGPDPGNRKKEMAIAIWVSSSVLLLMIAAFLVYGCLRIWCRRRRELGKGTAAGVAAKQQQQQSEEQQLLLMRQQQQPHQQSQQQPVQEEQRPLQNHHQRRQQQEEREELEEQDDDADENRRQKGRLAERAEEPAGEATTPIPDRGQAGDSGGAIGGGRGPTE